MKMKPKPSIDIQAIVNDQQEALRVVKDLLRDGFKSHIVEDKNSYIVLLGEGNKCLRKHLLGEKVVVAFSSKPLDYLGKVLYKINPESNSPSLSNLLERLMYLDFCISTTFGMGDN